MICSEISLTPALLSSSILSHEEPQQTSANALSSIYKAALATIAGFSIYKTFQSKVFSEFADIFKGKISTLNIKTFTPTKSQALIGAIAIAMLAIHQQKNIKTIGQKAGNIALKTLNQIPQTTLKAKTKAASAFGKYKTLWKTDTAKMIAIHTLTLAILATTVYALRKRFHHGSEAVDSQATVNNPLESVEEINPTETLELTTESTSSKTNKIFNSTKKFLSTIKDKISEKAKNLYTKIADDIENKTIHPYSPENKFAGLFQFETRSETEKEEEEKQTSKANNN